MKARVTESGEVIPNSWQNIKNQGRSPGVYIGHPHILDHDTIPDHLKETLIKAAYSAIEIDQENKVESERQIEIGALEALRRERANRHLGELATEGQKVKALLEDNSNRLDSVPVRLDGQTTLTEREHLEQIEARRNGVPM